MGFIAPAEPTVDLEEWKARSHLERIKPVAQDWALNGFGTPYFVYLLYIVKCAVYVFAGLLVISTTPGLGSIGEVGSWWTEPIVFQKAVVWTMLWEVLGLGAGSFPLTFRFTPPIGGLLHWLRPGTIRLPPWPERVPLTRGTRRTVVDVVLYAAVVGSAVFLLVSGGDPSAGTSAGRLAPTGIAILLGCLVVLGLRDKVPFLAARSEHYAMLAVVFLFPFDNLIVGSQLVFIAIWWGAAASKLNKHFPHVVSVMTSNTPWQRSKSFKRRLWASYPDDLRPSRLAEVMAHGGTVVEFGAPLVLLLSDGGTIGMVALVVMILFHVHIFSTFPLAVPLEWNLMMIFALLFLFGHYGDVPLSTLESPILIALLAVGLVAIPVLGNLRPDLISFLPSMRYYAGNWATSQWCFRKDGGEARLDRGVVKAAPLVVDQLAGLYGRDMAEFMLGKGLAFRAMHTHGRAICGLLPRALDDVEAYDVREGELVCGVVLGYNFGDGHMHNEQLLAAVQERCHFEPGELRVIMLESEPAFAGRGRGTQHYRIHDAAMGLLEQGRVNVADMVARQPWLDDTGTIPVEVIESPAPGRPAVPAT